LRAAPSWDGEAGKGYRAARKSRQWVRLETDVNCRLVGALGVASSILTVGEAKLGGNREELPVPEARRRAEAEVR